MITAITTTDRMEILEMKRRGKSASAIKAEFDKKGKSFLWLELIKIYNEGETK